MSNHIKTVEISYYRSYLSPQELSLGQPNNEKEGSGLTVIVGPNNAGKTTLLEALTLDKEKRIGDNEKVNGNEPKIIFKLESGDEKELTTAQPGSAQLVGETVEFEPVPSRRIWESKGNSNRNIKSIFTNVIRRERMRGSTNQFRVSDYLKEIESIDEQREEFTRKLQKVFSNFTNWSVGHRDGTDYIKYKTSSGATHRTDFLGDGVSSVFRILAHIQHGDKPLIIDEPELSLQPEAQKKLLRLLAKESKNRQIVISTHSPYFINLNHFKNGANYARVNKHQDEKSEINELQEYSHYESLFSGANWEQPFLFDEVAKEIFFQDNILFLEGQHDVGLLKKYFTENNYTPSFNIFGYGVRGYNNFEFALTFAEDLGLEKAAVMLDSGDDENSILESLRDDFSDCEYLIEQWDKEDIRDKEKCDGCDNDDCKLCNYHRERKEGYFDKDGNLKPESREDFENKIEVIKNYFDNQD